MAAAARWAAARAASALTADGPDWEAAGGAPKADPGGTSEEGTNAPPGARGAGFAPRGGGGGTFATVTPGGGGGGGIPPAPAPAPAPVGNPIPGGGAIEGSSPPPQRPRLREGSSDILDRGFHARASAR